MLTREYELSFKPKLKDFFTQLKLTRNKEMIDEIISVFSLSKSILIFSKQDLRIND
jgi:hypothetical protein